MATIEPIEGRRLALLPAVSLGIMSMECPHGAEQLPVPPWAVYWAE